MKNYISPIRFFTVCLMAICALYVSSQNSKASPDTKNEFRSVEYNADGIVVTCDFTKLIELHKLFFSQEDFSYCLNDFSSFFLDESAELPQKSESFLLPIGSFPKLEIIEESFHEVEIPQNVSTFNCDKLEKLNPEVCSLQPLQKYRRYPIALVDVAPVVFLKDEHKLKVYDKVKYRIRYNNNNESVEKASQSFVLESESLVDPNGLYASNLIDPILPPGFDPIVYPVTNPGYLIMSVPEFKEHLEPFVKWKKVLGYTVFEAYDIAWTPEKIKTYISNLYQEHEDLQYFLIVGDHNLVPAEIKYTIDNGRREPILSDFHYACLDGDDDLFADIYRGRWPIRTISELELIIEKSIRYEMEPTVSYDFYNSSSHFGYFEDERKSGANGDSSDPNGVPHPDGVEDKRFVKTCEDVRDYLLDNNLLSYVDRLYVARASVDHQYIHPFAWNHGIYSYTVQIPDDMLYENGFLWNANADSVINAINDGRLYFLYRGHGFSDGWGLLGKEGAQFTSEYVEKLYNIDMMPLIFSITCNTGNHSAENNFVRSLLSHPYGGTFAVFAQTNSGFPGLNDRLTSFFINCVWPSPGINMDYLEINDYWQKHPMIHESLPALRLGQMLDISINGTAEYYSLSNSETSLGLYLKRITHCFGDPSISFRTKMPSPIRNVLVTRNNDNGSVHVSVPFSGTNNYISFYDKTTGQSKMYRGTNATFYTGNVGGERYVDVFVNNGDVLPYFNPGENYDGYIGTGDESRLISHSFHTNGKYLNVEYYLSETHRNSNVGILVVDLQTNNFIYKTNVDSSICGVESTIPVYANNGLIMVSLTIDGMPVSNMKVFVPQN